MADDEIDDGDLEDLDVDEIEEPDLEGDDDEDAEFVADGELVVEADDDAVVVVVEEEAEEVAAAAPKARKKRDEEEDDEEEADPDDVEADLDKILKERIAANDDEDEDEELEEVQPRTVGETAGRGAAQEGRRVHVHRLLPAGQRGAVRSTRPPGVPRRRERVSGDEAGREAISEGAEVVRAVGTSAPERDRAIIGTVSDRDDAKTPLEHMLDVCVYAPLGFALEARSLLPKFVDRGRNQVVLARVVGKYAVRKGTSCDRGCARTGAGAGARGATARGRGTRRTSLRRTAAHPTARTARRRRSEATEPAPRPTSTIDPATLAIPDYDALSASQVVPRLESLTTDELEAVRAYESDTRGRKTILNKVAQLQSS